jgi:hypothetical protein
MLHPTALLLLGTASESDLKIDRHAAAKYGAA